VHAKTLLLSTVNDADRLRKYLAPFGLAGATISQA
jgi:sigma54-dependent transcription regulator